MAGPGGAVAAAVAAGEGLAPLVQLPPPQVYMVWIGHLPAKVVVAGQQVSFPFEVAYAQPAAELFGCIGSFLAELDLDQPPEAPLTTFGCLYFQSADAAQRCANWVCCTPVRLGPRVMHPPDPSSVRVRGSWGGGHGRACMSVPAHALHRRSDPTCCCSAITQ